MNPRRKMGKSGILPVYKTRKLCYNIEGMRRRPAAAVPLRSPQFHTEPFFSACGPCPQGKRESGASPERSGHCKRGDPPQNPLCHGHEKERHASTIRKSGNLLKDAAHSFRRKRPAQTDRPRSLFCTVGGACFSEERRALLLWIVGVLPCGARRPGQAFGLPNPVQRFTACGPAGPAGSLRPAILI